MGMTGDAVRQLLAEIRQRRLAVTQPVGTSVGADEVLAVIHDGGKLVAALTAVLDEFDYYSENGTEDEQDVIAAIRERLAAALEEQP